MNEKEPKFIVDRMLGKLNKWLRICGFDSIFWNNKYYKNIEDLIIKEDRYFLTKNSKIFNKLSKNNKIKDKIVFVKSDNYIKQLSIVKNYFNIKLTPKLNRCIKCNSLLKPPTKEEIIEKVPEFVLMTTEKFSICPTCKRIYWKGSHIKNIYKKLEEL